MSAASSVDILFEVAVANCWGAGLAVRPALAFALPYRADGEDSTSLRRPLSADFTREDWRPLDSRASSGLTAGG